MSLPGFRRVPVDLVLEVSEKSPGCEFFFDRHSGEIENLTLEPGRLASVEGGRKDSGRWASLYAVPTQALDSLEGKAPSREWLEAAVHEERIRPSGIDLWDSVPFFDNRDRIVRTYRVHVDGGDVTLEFVEENEGNPVGEGSLGGGCRSLRDRRRVGRDLGCAASFPPVIPDPAGLPAALSLVAEFPLTMEV
jgi:hypothetical protein